MRRAAAAQLARLAAAGVRGASPRQWYALTELSGPGPVTDGTSGCRRPRWRRFTKCGLRWLLESAAGVSSPSVLRHFGIVIHAAAALAADGADDADITKRIDEAWRHLDFGSAWYSAKQRDQAERMVRKFLDWHRANPRQLVAVEQELRVRVGRGGDHRPGGPAGARRRRHARSSSTSRPDRAGRPMTSWTGTRSSASTSWPCCWARSRSWA